MKIGFIDYYLDEWHANNYPKFLADASNGEITIGSAYGEIASPITGVTSEQWCEKYGIPYPDTVYSEDGESVSAKILINCAGLNSGKISAICGDNSFTVNGRKGEYILLDRESGDFVSHTLFFTPTKLGKGILVTQTVDNNVLLGPTAEEGVNSTGTSANGLAFVIEKAKQAIDKLIKNLMAKIIENIKDKIHK